MELNVSIHSMFLCVVNIIFTFSGVILNTLVIASFWKSSQLRKKICHFMIMLLSCFDLAAAVTNHPGILLYLISWLREDYGLLLKMRIYLYFANIFLAFSFNVLLVMNIERYLGAYYPIFHYTSVTRCRLLAVFAILLMPSAVMYLLSSISLVVSGAIFYLIFIVLHIPLFAFVNFKLYAIARKVHHERAVSSGKRTSKNLKNISLGLWAVACLMLSSIPCSFYIAFHLAQASPNTLILSHIWTITVHTTNCTWNSFIFFWKNKVLRTEGIKILKTLKDRLVGS